MSNDDEEIQLRSAALQNVQSILLARQRAEQELLRTKEELEDEKRILELLNQAGARLGSNLDRATLVQMVTDAATELSGAELGAFFYTARNRDGETLELEALAGTLPEGFASSDFPRSDVASGPLFPSQEVVRSDDLMRDPPAGELPGREGMPLGHLPLRSYLAVPVVSRSGEVIGGLFFGHHQPNIFTERTERVITGIVAQAAIALDNARLYEEARDAAEERARLLEAERDARAEVERVSLMKDEFLATLSHELRTPLSAVLGWSEVLLSATTGEAKLDRGLEIIARNARAQAQLIDDLLDMNRIVSGKIRLDGQRTDLVSIVEAAVDSVQPSTAAKSIRIRTVLDPKAGPVFGDPHRLQQVVWNLLTNAVKFTPKGGRIDVTLARVNSTVEITVQDSGAGINEEFLPHLFQRFQQADASTTRQHGGLGLGLSIVKQLVELHGGTVRAESEGDDRGSIFVVTLPVRPVRLDPTRQHPATRRQVHTRTAPEISLDKVKVLVVEDDPDARDLLEEVLSAASATVSTASSADEALALIATQRPDVLVSDIGMPDKDGYQFIREVRALPATEGGRIPAIALTAFARSEDRTRAMLAGYQMHVSKPIEPQELIATIGSVVDLTGRL